MLGTSVPETSPQLRQRMREFYETSLTYKNLLDAHDENYLRHFVDLVIRYASIDSEILDLGCGNGISSRLLNSAGFDVVGTDISPLFLQDARNWERLHTSPKLQYQVCDVLELPFEDESFDLVCSNELIEHLPDIETAFKEMIRVLRQNGKIVLSGPNLCSPMTALFHWTRLLWGSSNKMAGHPIWGDTKQQAWQQFKKNCKLYVRKRFFSKRPDFIYRTPDLQENALGGDADSAYLANPMDLATFFRQSGCRIVKKAVGFTIKGRIVANVFPYLSPYITMVVQK